MKNLVPKVTNSSVSSFGIFLFSAVLPHFVKVTMFNLEQNKHRHLSRLAAERGAGTSQLFLCAQPGIQTLLPPQALIYECKGFPVSSTPDSFFSVFKAIHSVTSLRPTNLLVSLSPGLSLAFRKRLSYDP